MRAHRTLVVSAVLGLALVVPTAAFGRALIIGGSTSVLPLAQKLAAAYHKAYPTIPTRKSPVVSPTSASAASTKAASTSATPRATRSKASTRTG